MKYSVENNKDKSATERTKKIFEREFVKDQIYNLAIVDKKSTGEIAQTMNIYHAGLNLTLEDIEKAIRYYSFCPKISKESIDQKPVKEHDEMELIRIRYEKIINLYLDGISDKKISEIMGISVDTVRRILTERSITTRKFKDIDISDETIYHLYVVCGLTYQQIGKKYGVHPQTAGDRVRAAGIESRGTRRIIDINE